MVAAMAKPLGDGLHIVELESLRHSGKQILTRAWILCDLLEKEDVRIGYFPDLLQTFGNDVQRLFLVNVEAHNLQGLGVRHRVGGELARFDLLTNTGPLGCHIHRCQ